MTRDELEAVCWRELGAIAAIQMQRPGVIRREWLTEAVDRILGAAGEYALNGTTPTEALLQAERRAVLARKGQ